MPHPAVSPAGAPPAVEASLAPLAVRPGVRSPQPTRSQCLFGEPLFTALCLHDSGNAVIIGTGTYGVWAQNDNGHYGILGHEDYGVYGEYFGNYGMIGTGAYGVYGENNNGSFGSFGGGPAGAVGVNANANYGALGEVGFGVIGGHYNGHYGSLGSSDTGAFGQHDSGNYGELGGSFFGARGWNANDNRGYLGHNEYGVWGTGTPWAGYFMGNVHVTGTLTGGSAASKVDHPLDPEGRYLSHAFVESPEMKNVYDGTVLLDAEGEAVVELPSYFEALNQDFRYQLTAIGAPAPNLYIADKIAGNRFKIAGGMPGMEVSWQVTGIRHDPWADEHRLAVEEEKPAEERGYYLHPQLYGQPQERSVAWVHDPEGMRAIEEMPARLETQRRRLEQQRQRLDEERQRMQQERTRMQQTRPSLPGLSNQ